MLVFNPVSKVNSLRKREAVSVAAALRNLLALRTSALNTVRVVLESISNAFYPNPLTVSYSLNRIKRAFEGSPGCGWPRSRDWSPAARNASRTRKSLSCTGFGPRCISLYKRTCWRSFCTNWRLDCTATRLHSTARR